MSLIWTLRKFVDSIAYSKEQEDQRSAREDQPADPKDADGDPPPVDDPPRRIERYVCRICAHESTADAFCPHCIAQTMVRKKT